MAPETIRTLLHNTKTHELSLTSLPAPSDPQLILLKVHTTSLTSGELLWTEALHPDTPVPGFDVAGTVISAPSNSKFKLGDSVYALTSFSRAGAARELQLALETELALKPASLSWEEAASVPLSALTAWQCLFVHGGLKEPNEDEAAKGVRVLITAASGGVGVWVVQLARLAGAYVVATCGPSNVKFVHGLGADEVLDYSKTNLKEWVAEDLENRRFDVVIDCKGGDVLEEAWTAVKSGGFFDSVAEPVDKAKPTKGVADGIRTKWFIVEQDGEQLAKISSLIETGKVKAVLDSVFALDDWEKAFERLNGGHARGKVVLKIAE